ncbi:MAG: hypothetical protein ACX930_15045 [Erythrobacter sp.]
MLAQIARREAMTALAEAIEEEDRTNALAKHCHTLMCEYGSRQPAEDAEALRDRTAFTASLQGVAKQAEQAQLDASDQTVWQADTLAAAETRAARIEERREAAKRTLEAVLERREQSHGQGVAHKLQCELPTAQEEAATTRQAYRSRSRP